MSHPEWQAMSAEQKMEFLYNWCFQMSEVVQELRATTQTLMDKVILVEAMLAERQHVVRRRELDRQRSEHDAKRRHHPGLCVNTSSPHTTAGISAGRANTRNVERAACTSPSCTSTVRSANLSDRSNFALA